MVFLTSQASSNAPVSQPSMSQTTESKMKTSYHKFYKKCQTCQLYICKITPLTKKFPIIEKLSLQKFPLSSTSMINLSSMMKKDSLKPGEEVDLKSKERKEPCIKKRSKKSKSGNMSNSERWLIDSRMKTRKKLKSLRIPATTIQTLNKKVSILTTHPLKAKKAASALLKGRASTWANLHKTKRIILAKAKHSKSHQTNSLSKRKQLKHSQSRSCKNYSKCQKGTAQDI